MQNHRYCVILCGGIGSRFWPLSREGMPKQFIDLFGTGRSLLQMTVDRIRPLVEPSHIFLLTNARYSGLIRTQLPEIPLENILLEPARRNTAPCLCWAAQRIQALDAEAAMVVLPSDHLVLYEERFRDAILRGFEFTGKSQRLLTLGITPTNPNTGYGYIQLNRAVENWDDFYSVRSFTEKPNEELAKCFVDSGEFFWNAGIFLWRADTLLAAFKEHSPEIYEIFEEGRDKYATNAEQEFINKRFPDSPANSIDYAVMEKAGNVYVETVSFGWSDLGTWRAYHETSPKTKEGNVAQNCSVMASGCTGCVFTAPENKLVVANGLQNYIVADTEDALLIYPIAQEQQIRHIVSGVKERYGTKFS